MKRGVEKITLEWLRKAEDDLEFATVSLEELDDFYSHICILCHDSVEKFLKALLISQGKKPLKIHDLVTLLNDCISISRDKTKLQSIVDSCRILNQYYIPLKYPTHYPPATKEQAVQAVKIAGEVAEMVNEEI